MCECECEFQIDSHFLLLFLLTQSITSDWTELSSQLDDSHGHSVMMEKSLFFNPFRLSHEILLVTHKGY